MEGEYARTLEKLGNDPRLDFFFQGVINSLYYKPNRNVLVLEGESATGKSNFFRSLFPHSELFTDHPNADVYSYLFIDKEFTKDNLNLPLKDDFFIPDGDFPDCQKRLASYVCSTQKWTHPPRVNFIVVKLTEPIEPVTLNFDLWKEIFSIFRNR